MSSQQSLNSNESVSDTEDQIVLKLPVPVFNENLSKEVNGENQDPNVIDTPSIVAKQDDDSEELDWDEFLKGKDVDSSSESDNDEVSFNFDELIHSETDEEDFEEDEAEQETKSLEFDSLLDEYLNKDLQLEIEDDYERPPG